MAEKELAYIFFALLIFIFIIFFSLLLYFLKDSQMTDLSKAQFKLRQININN